MCCRFEGGKFVPGGKLVGGIIIFGGIKLEAVVGRPAPPPAVDPG